MKLECLIISRVCFERLVQFLKNLKKDSNKKKKNNEKLYKQ